MFKIEIRSDDGREAQISPGKFLYYKMDDIFSNIVAVCMEDIIEIQNIPQKAIVTRIQSSAGEFPKSVSRSLPHSVPAGINVYGWTPDIEKNKSDQNTEEYKTSRSFIRF